MSDQLKPGTIRVVDGVRHRFVEQDDRGEVWEILDTPSVALKGEALPVAWQVRTRGKTTWSSWWHSDEKPDPTDFDGGYGVEIRPLYARPSPGVSREDVARKAADHFGWRPFDEMAEDKAGLRKLYRDGDGSFDINEPTQGDCLDFADALALLSQEPTP